MSFQGAKDAPGPRPNKRRRLATSPTEHGATLAHRRPKSNRKSDPDAPPAVIKGKDASLEEFLEVMQSKATKGVASVDQADPLSSSSKKDKAPATQRMLQDPSEAEVQRDLTDMEWMRQRMKGGVEDVASPEKAFEQSDTDEQDLKISEKKDPTEETILHTARLFVRNLTFTCTEEELRELFQSFGIVSQVSRTLLLGWIESLDWREKMN